MKRFALILLALCLAAIPSWAVEPVRREVVVVSARVWDGYQYKDIFLPSNRPELTLIAGQDSAVALVRTQEYYWPLSRQVYVDFEQQRDVVDGTLRIEQANKVIAEEAMQSYSIIYPQGAINGNGSLLWGRDAEAGYAGDQQAQRDFERRYIEVQRANTEYEQQLLVAGAARVKGGPVQIIPPPPPMLQPRLTLVTKPVNGFRIQLEPGNYRMSVWKNGAKVAGTERDLRVVSVAGREELVADIMPEERWTHPLATNSVAARIFARPGATFFMTLANASRFDEADYLPVVSPQSEPVAGRNMWVRRKPAVLDAVEVSGARLPLESYKVEQTQGGGFGYVVRRAKPGETPDLTAFAISVPAASTIDRVNVTATSAGFEREIVVVNPRRSTWGFLLALVPMFAAGGFWMARRRPR